MATLTPTLKLTSSDVMTDTLSLSTTDSLTISGDVVGISRVALSTGDLTLLAAASYTKSYVYLKNPDTTDSLIFADDGDQIFCRLAPGEFAFYPTADNTKIQCKSTANTPIVEFMLLEVD